MRNSEQVPLVIHILRIDQKFYLEVENTGEHTLTDITLEPVFVSGYEEISENIMVKFEPVSILSPSEKYVMPHQTYFPKVERTNSQEVWEKTDPFYDFIMVLTEKLSRGVKYTLSFSFSVDGEPARQDVTAGAGSGLQDIREIVIEKGKRIYEGLLRDQLEDAHSGRYVAIEPDSGEYFLGDSSAEALRSAHKALPESRFFLARVGYRAAHTISGHAFRNR